MGVEFSTDGLKKPNKYIKRKKERESVTWKTESRNCFSRSQKDIKRKRKKFRKC